MRAFPLSPHNPACSLAQRSAAPRSSLASAPAPRPFHAAASDRFRMSGVTQAAVFGNVDVKAASELVQTGQAAYVDVR
jgi:hypothetical protein